MDGRGCRRMDAVAPLRGLPRRICGVLTLIGRLRLLSPRNRPAIPGWCWLVCFAEALRLCAAGYHLSYAGTLLFALGSRNVCLRGRQLRFVWLIY